MLMRELLSILPLWKPRLLTALPRLSPISLASLRKTLSCLWSWRPLPWALPISLRLYKSFWSIPEGSTKGTLSRTSWKRWPRIIGLEFWRVYAISSRHWWVLRGESLSWPSQVLRCVPFNYVVLFKLTSKRIEIGQ